jgi:hypothetical protein
MRPAIFSPVRQRLPLVHLDAGSAAALHELEAEPALAGARLRNQPDDLAVARARLRQRVFQGAELPIAPHESGEAARARHVEARAAGAGPQELEHLNRLARSFHLEGAEVVELEVALEQRRAGAGHVDRVGRCERLHALREPDRVALCRVVHAQVVADLADHDIARVEAHARRERDAVLALHLACEGPQRFHQVERREGGALRVVLVRDRRAEERHDPVARVLVHRALEAVHAVGQDLEEALEDAVPGLGVELAGQLHRAREVGEEHGHLLALAFECGAGPEDLVAEMLRRVVSRVARLCGLGCRRGRGGRRGTRRHEHVALARRDALHVDELLDECLHSVFVEIELEAQRAQRHAVVLLEVGPGPVDRFEKAHAARRAAPWSQLPGRSALDPCRRQDKPPRNPRPLPPGL